jgi:branched-chain amino acid transport system ATP-binding protein
MVPLLELAHVSKRYGALAVVDDLSLELREGEALGIVGPNGAGKTTVFNLIAGSVRVDRGQIRLAGREVTRLGPTDRCRAGIGRTYQVPRPFVGMSVFENVLVAAAEARGRSEKEAEGLAVQALQRVDLLADANRTAGSLTLLERKRLELARALATSPRVLLLDEIAGGLVEPEVQALVDLVRRLRSEGLSILWTEHIVHAVLSVVDRLVVLSAGRMLREGNPQEVMGSAEVQEIYLGVGTS